MKKENFVLEKVTKQKVIAGNFSQRKSVLQFLVFVCLASFAPVLGNQAITGTIVNATLFASTILLGVRSAVLIALFPSCISLTIGFLPAVMAPMIPFIIFSNIVLVFVFNSVRNRSYWTSAAVSSFLKFSILYLVSTFILENFIKGKVAENIAVMMSWPQLYTALSGAIIAFFFLKAIGKIEK